MNEQKSSVTAIPEVRTTSEKSEVEEEFLVRKHSDLRIAPVGWTPADADPNDPISFFHLRIKRVELKQEAD